MCSQSFATLLPEYTRLRVGGHVGGYFSVPPQDCVDSLLSV